MTTDATSKSDGGEADAAGAVGAVGEQLRRLLEPRLHDSDMHRWRWIERITTKLIGLIGTDGRSGANVLAPHELFDLVGESSVVSLPPDILRPVIYVSDSAGGGERPMRGGGGDRSGHGGHGDGDRGRGDGRPTSAAEELCATIVQRAEAQSIIGVEYRRTWSGGMVLYMGEVVMLVFPSGDFATTSASPGSMSEIYYLPQLYWMMERGHATELIFRYERLLAERLLSDRAAPSGPHAPHAADGSSGDGGGSAGSEMVGGRHGDRRGPPGSDKRGPPGSRDPPGAGGPPRSDQRSWTQGPSLRDVIGEMGAALEHGPTLDPPILTGMTAAALALGETPQTPYELVTDDFAALDRYGRSKGYEVRRFQVMHPCGSRYISVMQLLSDKRLTVMAYNTLQFEESLVYSAELSGGGSTAALGIRVTSPYFTLAQLCLAEWLLSRKSIERYKVVRRTMHAYREMLVARGSSDDASWMVGGHPCHASGRVGTTRDWVAALYYRA